MSKKILYEGKAKQLYETEKPSELIQFFKDDATAFNKKKHEIIDSKGVLNNLISEYIFIYLGKNNISNHFIKRLSPREQLIKRVEIIPIEVVVRNIAAGTFSQRFGIDEGKHLPKTLIEFNLKDDNDILSVLLMAKASNSRVGFYYSTSSSIPKTAGHGLVECEFVNIWVK